MPQDVADSTSESEKKRQEALNEVFYTERDFVRDMEYLRDVRPVLLIASALGLTFCHSTVLDQAPANARHHS